jgi:hypothetical protein
MTQANLFAGCDRMHVDDQRRKLLARLAHLDTKLDQDCPLCTQRVKLYRRKLNSQMARFLVQLVRLQLDGPAHRWYHARDILGDASHKASSDGSYLTFWGFIEAKPKDPGTDGRTSGYWRATAAGLEFALGRRRAPSHALIFNGEGYGLTMQKTITIRAALGSRFSYDELMGGSR